LKELLSFRFEYFIKRGRKHLFLCQKHVEYNNIFGVRDIVLIQFSDNL
jgi:hypothetical protein